MTDAKRILVINDTAEILELFSDIIRGLGHEPILISYAPDDLRQIEEHHPDVVIVDFVLGGREYQGWQLLQKMRMNRATQSIPIIACTAAVQAVHEAEGYLIQQGISVVLKPFAIEQLEEAIAVAVKAAESNSPSRKSKTDR